MQKLRGGSMSGRGKKLNQQKNASAHDEWTKAKRTDRPYQQWNEETKTWGKIVLPKKVDQ
jgi:hypothetical protein